MLNLVSFDGLIVPEYHACSGVFYVNSYVHHHNLIDAVHRSTGTPCGLRPGLGAFETSIIYHSIYMSVIHMCDILRK